MFTREGWLILLLLIPLIGLIGMAIFRARAARLRALDFPVRRIDGRRLKLILWAGASACCVVALANPVWGVEAELIESHGTAVMLVLDVSASMDALDMLPSRLERAKIAADDLLAMGEGSLFGGVLFAGQAFVQFPLTSDIETARSFIRTASSRSITYQGTAIGEALRLALAALDERSGGDAAIILMTDGENHSGEPLTVADEAAARGIPIHVIGYGTPEGDVIPVYDDAGIRTGVKANAAREIVYSRLDEPILQQIAMRSGGLYQRASETGVETVAVLNALAELNAGLLGARLHTLGVSRYAVFVALALILLTAEMLTRERVI